jgi:hypothetical protein
LEQRLLAGCEEEIERVPAHAAANAHSLPDIRMKCLRAPPSAARGSVMRYAMLPVREKPRRFMMCVERCGLSDLIDEAL